MPGVLKRLILWVGLALILPASAQAGGMHVLEETLRINGRESVALAPGKTASLAFDAKEYELGAQRYKYFIFMIEKEGTPASRSGAKALAGSIYYVLAGDRVSADGEPEGGANRYKFSFRAPTGTGQYDLNYHQISVFRGSKLAETDRPGEFTPAAGATLTLLRSHMASINMFATATRFTVSNDPNLTAAPALYLRLNGRHPILQDLQGGVTPQPVEFSWFLGDEVKWDRSKVAYRYKIWPIDDDYGPWMGDTSVRYHFLQKGSLRFLVQAQYRDGPNVVTTDTADFSFELAQHLVARPAATAKGPVGKPFEAAGLTVASPEATNIAFGSLYGRSRALLVGVHQFDDDSLSDFERDRIRKDIDKLSEALRLNGFEVSQLFADRLTRQDIMLAVEKLVNETKADDRLFIYFSTHGFPDPKNPASAFLATSDCSLESPSVNCIPINDVERQSDRALNAKARQVLIVLDSCFSGLGVVSKAAASPNFARLATKPGAYMLTAGMSDQIAQIDNALGMSTFTHFLVKGLEGEAERYDRGGVITLTDLYNYVQYEVASRTGSLQIPMLGRLQGDGEMLFKPAKQN